MAAGDGSARFGGVSSSRPLVIAGLATAFLIPTYFMVQEQQHSQAQLRAQQAEFCERVNVQRQILNEYASTLTKDQQSRYITQLEYANCGAI